MPRCTRIPGWTPRRGSCARCSPVAPRSHPSLSPLRCARWSSCPPVHRRRTRRRWTPGPRLRPPGLSRAPSPSRGSGGLASAWTGTRTRPFLLLRHLPTSSPWTRGSSPTPPWPWDSSPRHCSRWWRREWISTRRRPRSRRGFLASLVLAVFSLLLPRILRPPSWAALASWSWPWKRPTRDGEIQSSLVLATCLLFNHFLLGYKLIAMLKYPHDNFCPGNPQRFYADFGNIWCSEASFMPYCLVISGWAKLGHTQAIEVQTEPPAKFTVVTHARLDLRTVVQAAEVVLVQLQLEMLRAQVGARRLEAIFHV